MNELEGVLGEVLAPDVEWVWRYAERVTPLGQLLGYSLENDNGASGPIPVRSADGAGDCGSWFCSRATGRFDSVISVAAFLRALLAQDPTP